MDKMTYHSIDVQWGNRDVLWMGAAAGQMGCIANAIRICARYGNLDILEDGYGISFHWQPLRSIHIGDDPCTCFQLKGSSSYSASEREMNQKDAQGDLDHPVQGGRGRSSSAIRNLVWKKRNLLHHIDFERGVLEMDGRVQRCLI